MPFRDTNFGLSLGLYQENTNKFVYIDECKIQSQLVNTVINKVLTILRRHNETTDKKGGVLKYLVVRALESSKEAQVTFILKEFKDSFKEIGKEVYDSMDEIKSVFYSIQDKNSVSIFGSTTILLEGRNYIRDNMLGLKVSLSPKSFYQLNSEASKNLYSEILNSDIKETDIVFDCYSGIGRR